MTRLTHLNSLQALEAALRCGSLKKAAQELNISAAAVGQRIRALEDYIGRTLLVRDSSGLAISPELDDAQSQLVQGFACLQEAAEKLRIPHSNRVAVTGNTDWLTLWLKPRLEAFAYAHPGIELVVLDDSDTAMDSDIVVTFREGGDETLLFGEYQVPLVSPENQLRIQNNPEETRLDGFPLLHLHNDSSNCTILSWPDWIGKFGGRSSGAERGVRYSRLTNGLQGVYANAGVLLCGVSLVLDQVDSGNLKLPFDAGKGVWCSEGYHFDVPPNCSVRRPVHTFILWLKEQAAATEKRLRKFANRPAPESYACPSPPNGT